MILDRIAAAKKKRLAWLMEHTPLSALMDQIALNAPSALEGSLLFEEAMLNTEFAVIAESKKASPSQGLLSEYYDPQANARQYARCGADAVSVLTEEDFFMGSSVDLQAVKEAVTLPVLRKDFILDEWQIYESKVLGADAVLLIAALLTDGEMNHFLSIAQTLGLSVLTEVHNRAELIRALDCGATLLGINNRDLQTFQVSLDTTEALMPYIPKGRPVISESGVHTPADVLRLQGLGVRGVLIGEALMRARSVEDRMMDLFGRRAVLP